MQYIRRLTGCIDFHLPWFYFQYLAVYLQSVSIFSTAPRPSYLLNMADYSEGNIQDVWVTSLITARKSLRERERERLRIMKGQMCEDGVIDSSYHNKQLHTTTPAKIVGQLTLKYIL